MLQLEFTHSFRKEIPEARPILPPQPFEPVPVRSFYGMRPFPTAYHFSEQSCELWGGGREECWEERGRVIYKNQFRTRRQILKETILSLGQSDTCIPEQTQPAALLEPLSFDSSFESGNLKLVQSCSSGRYRLLLRNDFNHRRCRQWFCFKAQARQAMKAQFKIANFRKSSSLYQKGMRIAVCSSESGGWTHGCTEIQYMKNQDQGSSLFFNYDFKSGEAVCFAFSIPYTYSYLNQYLSKLQEEFNHTSYFKRRRLCNSLLGNAVNLLYVGDFVNKPIVLVICRTHPGQTVSNFVLQGFIDHLLRTQTGQQVRSELSFIIVPMLNVDGVVVGNYRSNMAGVDLNRKWAKNNFYEVCMLTRQHPQLYYLKRLIMRKSKQIVLVLDLHGHSKNLDFFTYSLSSKTQQNLNLFPSVLSTLSEFFSMRHSKANGGEGKVGSARVVLTQALKQSQVFTIEHSFCSWKGSEYQFSVKDYFKIGESVLKAVGVVLLKQANLTAISKAQILKRAKLTFLVSSLKEEEEQSKEESESESEQSEEERFVVRQEREQRHRKKQLKTMVTFKSLAQQSQARRSKGGSVRKIKVKTPLRQNLSRPISLRRFRSTRQLDSLEEDSQEKEVVVSTTVRSLQIQQAGVKKQTLKPRVHNISIISKIQEFNCSKVSIPFKYKFIRKLTNPQPEQPKQESLSRSLGRQIKALKDSFRKTEICLVPQFNPTIKKKTKVTRKVRKFKV